MPRGPPASVVRPQGNTHVRDSPGARISLARIWTQPHHRDELNRASRASSRTRDCTKHGVWKCITAVSRPMFVRLTVAVAEAPGPYLARSGLAAKARVGPEAPRMTNSLGTAEGRGS